jgi:hypothetical protein
LFDRTIDKSVGNYFARIVEGDAIRRTVDVASSSSSNIGSWEVAGIISDMLGIYRS